MDTTDKDAKSHKDAKTDRLGAALRENLKRRKVQQRGRERAGAEPDDRAGSQSGPKDDRITSRKD